MISGIETHRVGFENSFKIFPISTPIIIDRLLHTIFILKAPDRLNPAKLLLPNSITTIWNEIPLALRNFKKSDFNRKITRMLFGTLNSEDSYLYRK